MFAICGKDSDNRTFTVLRGFLPSQRRWVFHWLWETAIPTLLKPPSSVIPPLSRNEIVLTDNDEKEWGPLEGCLADDSSSYSSRCKCRTCSWHLANRGLKSHPLGATKTAGVAAQNVVDAFTTWIYSWMMSGRGVESKDEYLVSRDLIFTYLESKSSMHAPHQSPRSRTAPPSAQNPTQTEWLQTSPCPMRCATWPTELQSAKLNETVAPPPPWSPPQLGAVRPPQRPSPRTPKQSSWRSTCSTASTTSTKSATGAGGCFGGGLMRLATTGCRCDKSIQNA